MGRNCYIEIDIFTHFGHFKTVSEILKLTAVHSAIRIPWVCVQVNEERTRPSSVNNLTTLLERISALYRNRLLWR